MHYPALIRSTMSVTVPIISAMRVYDLIGHDGGGPGADGNRVHVCGEHGFTYGIRATGPPSVLMLLLSV